MGEHERTPVQTRAGVLRYREAMLILGVILLVLGLLLGLHILYIIGIVLAIVGAVLLVLDLAGHAVGGRRLY